MREEPGRGNAGASTRPLKAESKRRTPSYLYVRGTIYYFRYVLTPDERERYGRSEIRLSLRTGFLGEAKRMARRLRTRVEGMLMTGEKTINILDACREIGLKPQKRDDKLSLETFFEKSVADSQAKLTEMAKASVPPTMPEGIVEIPTGCSLSQRSSSWLERTRRRIAELNRRIAAYPEKTPPSPQEIKRRMQTLLGEELDSLDTQVAGPEAIGYCNATGNPFCTNDTSEILDSHWETLKKHLYSREWLVISYYPGVILALLDKGIFAPVELTDGSMLQILNEFQWAKISMNRILRAREDGDRAYELPFRQEAHVKVDSRTVSEPAQIMLSTLTERFVKGQVQDGKWKPQTVNDHKNRVNVLLEVVGDRPASTITKDVIRDFRDKLLKLPPNRAKNRDYIGKKIDEIIAMQPSQTLSIKTVNIHIEAVSSMFEWAIRENLLTYNPAKGMSIADERQAIELRDPFTPEEIRTIFFSGDYTPEKFKHPSHYWAPLIAIYTGMRLEEICQLYCDDVRKDENGIPYIDVNHNQEDQLLKNKNAVRKIPIHRKLVDLGLLDFVERVKAAGNQRLFPELNKTAKTQKYGKQVGNKFPNILKRHHIQGKKSFHSLRHAFAQFFKERNMQNDIFRQTFGHEIPELAAKQYGTTFSVKQCYDELISKLDWDA